jgi:hypothetical protein
VFHMSLALDFTIVEHIATVQKRNYAQKVRPDAPSIASCVGDGRFFEGNMT